MKKWEYKQYAQLVTEEELNILGEEGWELISHSMSFGTGNIRANHNYIFKREKN